MDYSRPSVPKFGDQIDVDDLTTFFVIYRKNDTLASLSAHINSLRGQTFIHVSADEIHDRDPFPRHVPKAMANIYRQLILIMSALGVPDSVFIQNLRSQLFKLEQAMTDERTALIILQKDIDQNQMTLTIAGMVLDGFQRSNEPFLTSLLQSWRAWSVKYLWRAWSIKYSWRAWSIKHLKEKARITIGGGAILFGCVDETTTLQGHFYDTPKPTPNVSISEKAKRVPEVFVQLAKGAGVDETATQQGQFYDTPKQPPNASTSRIARSVLRTEYHPQTSSKSTTCFSHNEQSSVTQFYTSLGSH